MPLKNSTPVLLLGYNRPDHLRELIRCLSRTKPSNVLVAIDGPKSNRSSDAELVRETRACVNEINWNATITTRFRDTNLGLRRAVVDAVSWATSAFGRAIVLEDDFRPGPEVVDYLNASLSKYESCPEIAHINGYNPVPIEYLSQPNNQSRVSRYVESYAWATWEHQWRYYDDEFKWGSGAKLCDIRKIVGTTTGAIRWKINFADASANRVDTWAYRWLASIWSQGKFVIAPNRNIGAYVGHEGGTHTRSRGYRDEPPIQQLMHLEPYFQFDASADAFISRNIFREGMAGVLRGGVNSIILETLRRAGTYW